MGRHAVTVAAILVTSILLTSVASASRRGMTTPVNIVPPSVSGTSQVGSTLSASVGPWSGKALKYGYRWLRCDSAGASCVEISGATSSSYPVSSGMGGQTVRVIVTATNKAGSTAATSNATAVI